MQNRGEAKRLAVKTEEVLGMINMSVKGWAVSGEDPPPELTRDGVSVGMCGISWFPRGDFYQLGIENLHFRKKKCRRLPSTVPVHDGRMPIDEFTPANLSRRMSTSEAAMVWDLCGKLAPLLTKIKYDLRRLIKEDSDWDNPLPS